MDRDALRRGILPGIMAGYIFLAFVGAGIAGVDVAAVVGEDGAISTTTSLTSGLGMIDMVAGALGSDALIAFILHVVASAVIGALYTGLFASNVKLGNPLLDIAVGGLIYGIIWWIIGAGILIPIFAGSDLLQLGLDASFYGHIIFGHMLAFLVVLRGLVFEAVTKAREASN